MTTDSPTQKRELSIENLLHWAYQTELCNLVVGDGAVEPGEQHPMWKMRVDGTPHGWDANAVARVVHEDALRVHAAVAGLATPSWANGAVFPSIAYAAWRISFAEQPFIDRAIDNAQTLVIRHAVIGDRPIADETPSPHCRRLPSGRPEIVRNVMVEEKLASGDMVTLPREMLATEQRVWRKRAGVYETGSYCLLDYWPSEENVLRDRANYVVWRAALAWLAEALRNGLDRFGLTDALPPEVAWT